MRAILLFFVFIPVFVNAQCDYSYFYMGKPNAIFTDSFAVVPNDLYQFDFSALNVPDALTIYTNKSRTDSIYFYIGRNAPFNPNINSYNGYCEFEYDSVLTTISLNVNKLPVDYHVDSVINDPRGCMRLYYRVPNKICNLVFKVSGNKTDQTVYGLCVKKLETGFIEISDTIHQPYCGKKYPIYVEGDCDKSIIIFDDYSVKDEPIIHHDGCAEELGWIEFPNYPQFNHYDLGVGVHKILVSNQYCNKIFEVDIPEKKLCQYYLPNVFKMDGGKNGQFILYTKNINSYRMKIFDRWGNLVYQKEFVTNISGWDGRTMDGEDVQVGVYVFQIECLDLKLSGDVTVLK